METSMTSSATKTTTGGYDHLVRRDDLSAIEARPRTAIDPATLAANQILCRIDQYALTANNVTYGVAGDSIGYWGFFPAPEGFGRLPVWGFATVTASSHADVKVGERLYGYWPMSSDVVLAADHVTPSGLIDAMPHRAKLPALYNRYARLAGDPSFPAGTEAHQALIRPLFLTSFLIDDFLDDNGFFQADTVIITSASSKTGIGLAAMLERRKALGMRTVALTSPANRAFVARLGLYDDVVTYDDIPSLRAPGGAVLVDMAGSQKVLSAVHFALKDQLKYSCRVGMSHWQTAAAPSGLTLPGPKPLFFFAPDRVSKRLKDWGPAEFMQRTGSAMAGFIANSRRWMTIETAKGPDAITTVYRRLAAGEMRPETGQICEP
jgi:hypothetical protein